MIILVLVEEVDQALRMTLGVLDSCGFKAMAVESRELKMLSTEKIILLGKHPKRRYNGKSHRRRFVIHRRDGFWSVGYAEGADREVDHLWWRDLYCKLHRLIRDEIPESERPDLILPLVRLKEWGN